MEQASARLSPDGRCRSCGAVVAWVKTVRSKNLPLDLEPAGLGLEVRAGEPGNVVLRDGFAHVLGVGKRAEPGEPVWTPHFASFPARDHGGRGRPTGADAEQRRLDREAAERADRDNGVRAVLRRADRPKPAEGLEQPPPRTPEELALALRRISAVAYSLATELEAWERRGRGA